MRQGKQRLWVAFLTVLAVAAAWAADGRMMSVQVRDARVRNKASFVGKIVGTLAYGDRVEVRESKGDWVRVGLPGGAAGWMHASALTSKKIVLSAGRENAKIGASGDELALAGKGFNSDVEAQFRKNHRNIDFTWVDRMESIRISSSEMQAFLKAGGVTPKGGAQ